MGLIVRFLLAVAGVGAAFLVGRDADNFGVVQGMLASWLRPPCSPSSA